MVCGDGGKETDTWSAATSRVCFLGGVEKFINELCVCTDVCVCVCASAKQVEAG